MGKPIATKVYDLYGRFYDSFELLFRRRLARAIGAVPFRSGDHVLDVGVGTGLSLEFYPGDVRVTGIDLSPGMLCQAQRKIDEGTVRADSPREHTQLLQGDALNLPFANNSFDCVFLSHVISTVPDSKRCLTEAMRVAREGAYLVLVNHFRSPYPVISWVESAIDPICRKLGWRSDLSLEHLLATAHVKGDPRQRKGFIFPIVYLQKQRGEVRVVPMPEAGEREAALGPANA
ncbi:MAG: class I SAM-dependent methyltransferase [Phycisphaerae bacterium]